MSSDGAVAVVADGGEHEGLGLRVRDRGERLGQRGTHLVSVEGALGVGGCAVGRAGLGEQRGSFPLNDTFVADDVSKYGGHNRATPRREGAASILLTTLEGSHARCLHEVAGGRLVALGHAHRRGLQ